MRKINIIFRQKPQKSWGGALKKPVKIFIASLMLSILYTTPSLAIDDTTKAIVKTHFSVPTVANSDVVSSDSGTISLPNADALSDNHRGQDASDNYRSKVYGRVFVMATDAHIVDGNLAGIKICPIQINAAALRNVDKDSDAANDVNGGSRRRVGRFDQKEPDGTDKAKCRWVCAKGYTGKETDKECMIAVGSFKNDYGTNDLSWNNVSVKNNGSGSPFAAITFGARYVDDVNDTVHHNNLARMYLLATNSVSNGAIIQPVAISVKIGHKVELEDEDTKPRYKTVTSDGSVKVFCVPGYQPNSKNDGCEEIPTNPCYGASTFRVPFTYGTGSYVYNGALTCSYDAATNTWCKKPNGGTTKCAAGYYGNPSSATISSTCGWSSSGCTRCPLYGTNQYGTSAEGATKITQCYRSAQSGTKCDDIGCYTESGTCYYE